MSDYLTGTTSLVLALIAGSPAAAQTCRSLDWQGRQFQYMMGTYSGAQAGTPEAVTRDSLKLATVPASQVVLVTQSATCNKANTAYKNWLGTAAAGFSNQVYVLQVGTTYAVLDPAAYIGPLVANHNWVIVTLDSHFKPLSGM